MADRFNLTDGEKREPEWGCQHHRKAAEWLVIQIDNLLNGDNKEMTEAIIRGSLETFKKEYVEGK